MNPQLFFNRSETPVEETLRMELMGELNKWASSDNEEAKVVAKEKAQSLVNLLKRQFEL